MSRTAVTEEGAELAIVWTYECLMAGSAALGLTALLTRGADSERYTKGICWEFLFVVEYVYEWITKYHPLRIIVPTKYYNLA